MARLKKKTLEVQKFGGTDDLGKVKMGHDYDVKSIEAKSKTRLEDDTGDGAAAIIRRFSFGINPQAWMEVKPTKQELFNYHVKGIEMMLWRDGMKIMTEVEPRIVVDAENMRYDIFVGARPQKGHILVQRPQTLTEIAHG